MSAGRKTKETFAQLQAEKVEHLSVISDSKDEFVLLKSKFDNMTKSVRMLNNNSDVLDEILQAGKNAGNVEGLGYNDQTVMNRRKELEVKVVHLKKKHMSNQMSQHQQRHQKSCSGSKPR